MCVGIALAWSALPIDLIARHHLERRVHDRGGEREVQFMYHTREPCLPVWHQGQLEVVRWGSRRGQSRTLPCTGWTWQSTIDAGGWSKLGAELVEVPASMGLMNRVWYRIREGIRGVRVLDEQGRPAVYLVCRPSTHYYRVMTRSTWEPDLIGEII